MNQVFKMKSINKASMEISTHPTETVALLLVFSSYFLSFQPLPFKQPEVVFNHYPLRLFFSTTSLNVLYLARVPET